MNVSTYTFLITFDHIIHKWIVTDKLVLFSIVYVWLSF